MGEMGPACLVKHFNSQTKTNVKTKTMTKTKTLFRECLERSGTGLFSYTIEEKKQTKTETKTKIWFREELTHGRDGKQLVSNSQM